MPQNQQPSIRVGVGGWTFEPWRGAFYPQGLPHSRELEYASRRLTSIEINGTYYRTQTADSFAKWRDTTPEGFVFAVKGPRFATNRSALGEAGSAIEHFFNSGVMALGDKLGPVNWQLMPTKKFDAGDFGRFLELLPDSVEGRPIRHAVEVRHMSFASPECVALARRHGVAIVLSAGTEHPQIADFTAPFVYARITFTDPASFSPAVADLWAERARLLAAGKVPDGLATIAEPAEAGPRDVFLYVIAGDKTRNPAAAMSIIERLA